MTSWNLIVLSKLMVLEKKPTPKLGIWVPGRVPRYLQRRIQSVTTFFITPNSASASLYTTLIYIITVLAHVSVSCCTSIFRETENFLKFIFFFLKFIYILYIWISEIRLEFKKKPYRYYSISWNLFSYRIFLIFFSIVYIDYGAPPPNLYSASVFSSRLVLNIAICTVVGVSRGACHLSRLGLTVSECLFYCSLTHKQLNFTIVFKFSNWL